MPSVLIRSNYDRNKHNLLTAWIILWSIAGLAIIAQFFMPMPDGFLTYLVVWMAFWVYFEFKVVQAYRWRRYGRESISFDGENITLERSIAGRGIPQKFEVGFVKNIRHIERNERSFWFAVTSAYWNMGYDSLVFDYKGREVSFGRDLDMEEGKRVLREVKKLLKHS